MSEQVTYELAAVRWRRSQTVDIVTRLGNQIAVFPLSFLRSCGDNTWQYVLYVVNLLVDQIRGHPGRIVITDDVHAIDDALPVDLQSSPTAGTFCYIQDGIDREHTLSWGPEYSSRFKTPQFLPGSSTNSASSRTTGRPEQSSFKQRLIGRDAVCLLTEDDVEKCVAAHIVPQSRPDIYQQLLDEKHPDMFNTSAGLLINHNLHKTFDTLNWSLYHKDETYYIHYFSPRDPADFQLHGKAISPDRFSRFYDSPDPRLVAWHYSQAVKARIRGFSVGRTETKASKP